MIRLRFDRGTLVVVSHPPGLDVAVHPPFVLDDRDGRVRAPASTLHEIEALGARIGVPVRLEPELGSVACPERPALRAYQADAVVAWEAAGRRGVVVLPTGSGKTRVAIAAMTIARRPTLCVVPTRALMHQWRTALSEAGFANVGLLGDGNDDVQPCTIATSESAYRRMHRIGDRFDLLVVDEVHHFGLGVRDELLTMSLARMRLGLTATPREDGGADGTRDVGPVVYRLGLGDLAGSHLAPFDRVVLPVSLTPAEAREYHAAMTCYREGLHAVRTVLPLLTYTERMQALARTAEGRRALTSYRNARSIVDRSEQKRRVLERLLARHHGDRVLVFTGSAELACRFARELLVHPITAEIGRAEREAILSRFRAGDVPALISAQVLNEGIDVPDADVAIIAGGSRGVREHVQRVGRVLRPSPGKRATVYELVCRDTFEVAQSRKRSTALAS